LGLPASSYGLHLPLLVPYIRLESVTVCRGFEVFDFQYGQPRSGSKLDLADLFIEQSCISSDYLQHFLRNFRFLKRFQYDHKQYAISDHRPRLIPPVVGEGLAHLTHCLEELEIVDDHFDWIESNDEEILSPIGSLSAFQKLRSVKITAYILIGDVESVNSARGRNSHRKSSVLKQHESFADVLPASLERMFKYDRIPSALKAIELAFDERVPIHVAVRRGSPLYGFIGRNALEAFALEKGIVLTRHCSAD